MMKSLFYAATNSGVDENFDGSGDVDRISGTGMQFAGLRSINRQVPRPLWAAFLFEFSRDHQGLPVSIYTQQLNQSPSERAHKVPLESIMLDDDYGDKNFVHVRIAPHKFNRGIDFMFFAQVVSVEMDQAGKARRVIFDGSNRAQTFLML